MNVAEPYRPCLWVTPHLDHLKCIGLPDGLALGHQRSEFLRWNQRNGKSCTAYLIFQQYSVPFVKFQLHLEYLESHFLRQRNPLWILQGGTLKDERFQRRHSEGKKITRYTVLTCKMICRKEENMGKQTWLKIPHIKYLCGNGRREQGPLEKLGFISEESGGHEQLPEEEWESRVVSLRPRAYRSISLPSVGVHLSLTLLNTHWRCVEHHGGAP